MSASEPFGFSHVRGLRAVAWLASVAGLAPSAIRDGLAGCGRIPAERVDSLVNEGTALSSRLGSSGLRDACEHLEDVAAWFISDPRAAAWVRELRAVLAACPVSSEQRVAIAALGRGLPAQPSSAAPAAPARAVQPSVVAPPSPAAQGAVAAPPEMRPAAAAVVAATELAQSPTASEGVTIELEQETVELGFPMPAELPQDASELERQFAVRFAQDLARDQDPGPELDLGSAGA
jgi:hypothetical protein